jgi:ABC-type hemin transport system ATPase subunit
MYRIGRSGAQSARLSADRALVSNTNCHDFRDTLLSVAIVGRCGSGKTTLIEFLAAGRFEQAESERAVQENMDSLLKQRT